MDHGEVSGEGGGVWHPASRLQADAGSGEEDNTSCGVHERVHRRTVRHRSHQDRHPVSLRTSVRFKYAINLKNMSYLC